MNRTMIAAALSLTAFPLYAAVSTGDVIGISEADIRSSLEQSGYEVLSFEVEDNEIEVDVLLNGEAFEIELSADTGVITEIETSDDDDDD